MLSQILTAGTMKTIYQIGVFACIFFFLIGKLLSFIDIQMWVEQVA